MAFYAGQDHPAPGDGEPDAGRPDRPQRPGRPALRHLLAVPGPAAPDARCRPRAATICASCCKVASGGVIFTTIQKFLPDEKGEQLPAAVRPAQHRGHRRRGPPQPVRLHRRASPASTCATPCRNASLHRLHRHAHRDRPTGTRRPSSATTSTSTTSSGPSRTGPPSASTTRAGWRRLALKEDEKPKIDAEFEEVTEGEEQDAARSSSRRKWAQLEALVGADEAGRAGRRGPRASTSRRAMRGARRQGDDRLHEPPHLRGPLRRDRRRCGPTGTTTTTTRARSRS